VPHHHGVEAHRAVAAERLDDRGRAAHQQLVEAGAAVALGQDGADDGARFLIGGSDVDIAAQYRPGRAPGPRGGVAVEIQLAAQVLVRGVLAGEPGVAEPAGALGGGRHGAAEPDLDRDARQRADRRALQREVTAAVSDALAGQQRARDRHRFL
jgi:hypothetical protein